MDLKHIFTQYQSNITTGNQFKNRKRKVCLYKEDIGIRLINGKLKHV